MNQIESQLCVDIGSEFITGYDCASGGGAVPQLNCVSAGKLRGGLDVQGQEPGAPGIPGSLPTCNPAPSAMLFVHNLLNTDCAYNAVLPACARVLAQNGCSNTKCDPADPTRTTPYVVPAGVNLALAKGTCVQFNGCPTDYPVVFCTTSYAPYTDDYGAEWGVVPLAWDFFQRLGSRPPR